MMCRLIILGIAGLLSACVNIELSKRDSVQTSTDQDLPHKTYPLVGRACQSTDGGITTTLLRLASNRAKDDYTAPYLMRNEVVVVKTNGAGQVQWTKLAWSGSNASNSQPMIYSRTDGSYLVFLTAGSSTQSSTGTTYRVPVIVQLSATGEVISQQRLETVQLPAGFTALTSLSLPGKGFIVKGFIPNGSTTIPYLLYVDEQGKVIWNRSYEQITLRGSAYGLATTSNGGLILSSYGSNSVQAVDGVLLKLDASGQSVWLRRYTDMGATLVSETADKGFVLLGQAVSPSNDLILFKINADGDRQWSQHYLPATNQSASLLGFFASADSYVLIYSASLGGIDVLTTNLEGVEQDRQRITSPANSLVNGDLIRLADGSFVFVIKPPNSISLLKTKVDKTLQWQSVIATDM